MYMPNIKKGQDTLCWWRILKNGIVAYGMKEVLAVYRVGEKSLSSNKFLAIKRTWDLYGYENIVFIKKIYYFINYAINAIKRRVF